MVRLACVAVVRCHMTARMLIHRGIGEEVGQSMAMLWWYQVILLSYGQREDIFSKSGHTFEPQICNVGTSATP